MSKPRKRYKLEPIEVDYIKLSLENGSLTKKKQTLQYICRTYRQGGVINPRDRGLELLIMGLINADESDEKIRKWSLTALQHVGDKKTSKSIVLNTIKNFPNEPDVQAAAISTLFHYDPENAQKDIIQSGACSPNIITLAASQSNNKLKNSSSIIVDIEKSDIIEIKLSLILVGLDRAPNNLFNPNYSNAKIIKELGKHHDPIISQYTLWAAAENSNLGIDDIGINLKDIEFQPPNVRSYLYRLVAESNRRGGIYHDIIELGSKDDNEEARNGLAISLRGHYYDGLNNIMVDWYHDEYIPEIRDCVLDHLIAQSTSCEDYIEPAVEAYKENLNNKFKITRMDAAAAKTPLYPIFKEISYKHKDYDLFSRVDAMKNHTTVNFNNSNIGAVSTAGAAHNTGTVQSSHSVNDINSLKNLLAEIHTYIYNSDITQDNKNPILSTINNIKENPTNDNIKSLKDKLEITKNALSITDKTLNIAKIIGGYLSALSIFIGT